MRALGGEGCRGRLSGLVREGRGRKGAPELFLRTYYTPYDDCIVRCLSRCFRVAVFFCGPGVTPIRRCSRHITRVHHLVKRVRFIRPMALIRKQCSPRRFCRVTGNLRGIPRKKRQYFQYCHLQVRRTTGLTGRKKCSCFAAALDVDPLGGTRGVGRVNRRLTRVCGIPRLASSFGGGGNCGHSVRLSRRRTLCQRGCYNYMFSGGRTVSERQLIARGQIGDGGN